MVSNCKWMTLDDSGSDINMMHHVASDGSLNGNEWNICGCEIVRFCRPKELCKGAPFQRLILNVGCWFTFKI